jgi:hypothetical protein
MLGLAGFWLEHSFFVCAVVVNRDTTLYINTGQFKKKVTLSHVKMK